MLLFEDFHARERVRDCEGQCHAAHAPRLAGQTSVASDDPPTKTILVPAGTHVPVHLVGSISSSSAKAGDTFQIQAAENVVINGTIVIRNGAGGQGKVTEVYPAGRNGHSGSLGVTFDYIYSADGGHIRLLDAAQKQTEEDRKAASSTATIVGFATFGVGGSFGRNFAHGEDKKLDESTVIDAFVCRYDARGDLRGYGGRAV